MLIPILAFAMLFQYYDREPPDVPATVPNPEYPLHVRILNSHWNWMGRQGVHGFGRANLLTTPAIGIDYTYSCDEPFLHNQEPGEFYQAKWKKQDQEMTLLLQKVGSNKTQKCDVKVALHDVPYGRPEVATPQTTASQPASSTAPPAAMQPPPPATQPH